MLASMFLVGGFSAVKNPDALAPRAQAVTDRLVPLLQKARARSCRPTPPRWCGSTAASSSSPAPRSPPAGRRGPRAAALALTLVPTTVAGHRFWEESDPTTEDPAAAALLQERLDARWPDHRLRRHRGAAGRRLAGPSGRQGRPPRGQALRRHGPPRGEAGQGAGELSVPLVGDGAGPGPPRGRGVRSTPWSRCPAASR